MTERQQDNSPNKGSQSERPPIRVHIEHVHVEHLHVGADGFVEVASRPAKPETPPSQRTLGPPPGLPKDDDVDDDGTVDTRASWEEHERAKRAATLAPTHEDLHALVAKHPGYHSVAGFAHLLRGGSYDECRKMVLTSRANDGTQETDRCRARIYQAFYSVRVEFESIKGWTVERMEKTRGNTEDVFLLMPPGESTQEPWSFRPGHDCTRYGCGGA